MHGTNNRPNFFINGKSGTLSSFDRHTGPFMKRFLFLMLFNLLLQQLQAQTFHYLYLETEGGQPFYVRLQQKTYSSAASGYLLIPRLTAGKQVMTIGFPGDTRPREYAINLQQDAGYMLRKTGAGTWSLTDLSDPLKSIPLPDSSNTSQPSSSAAGLSGVLSQVVGDVGLDSDKKAEPDVMQQGSDSAQALKPKEKPVEEKPSGNHTVQLISRQSGPGGWNAIYVLQHDGKPDTVSVFIEETKESEAAVAATKIKKDSIIPSGKPRDEKIGISNPCKSVAGMPEFLRLRKLMAAQQTEEAMTDQARKFMRKTCISTEQAKRLSDLYLTEKERYAFFDLVYPNITDPERFPELEKQLTDTYFINRFRAMLR